MNNFYFFFSEYRWYRMVRCEILPTIGAVANAHQDVPDSHVGIQSSAANPQHHVNIFLVSVRGQTFCQISFVFMDIAN